MAAKRQVLIFPAVTAGACDVAACAVGCDHCRKGPALSSPRLTVPEVRRLLEQDYRDTVDVWEADYSTEAGRHEAVERINRLFDAGNVSMRIEPPGLDDFIAQAAPVIALDDRILSIIVVPTRDQLAAALSSPTPQ